MVLLVLRLLLCMLLPVISVMGKACDNDKAWLYTGISCNSVRVCDAEGHTSMLASLCLLALS